MKPVEAEAYVDAVAVALGLELQPAHRPGVLRYFMLAAGYAAMLDAVPLAPSDEPALHFVPLNPAEKQP